MISKAIYAAALWLIWSSISIAQPAAVEVIQTPVQFLTAKAASVEPDLGGGVLVFAEGLSTEVGSAVILEVTSGKATWASIHDRAKPFPPVIAKEWKPGKFLIRGRKGQVFYVSLGGDSDIPTWVEVSIGGVSPEPIPPVPPSVDLSQLSLDLASKLRDKPTAELLAKVIDGAILNTQDLCNRNQCPTLPGAKQIMVTAIEQGLAMRSDPFKADWLGGWRRPINEAIQKVNPPTVADYLALMRSVQVGLTRVQ